MNDPFADLTARISTLSELSSLDEAYFFAAAMSFRRCQLKTDAKRAAQMPDSGAWPPSWNTGTRLAVALILNRPDELVRMGYTFLDAMDRMGPILSSMLVGIQSELRSAGLLQNRPAA